MLQSTTCYIKTSNYNDANVISPQKGEIWYADLGNPRGSIQGGVRPVLIWSNNKFNFFSPVIFIIPISSKINKYSPVHVNLNANDGLIKESIALIEQMTTINKEQLKYKIGEISEFKKAEVLNKVDFQLQ